MYCPKCGNVASGGLKYCKSCGERLAKDEGDLDTPGKMLDGILETLFWTAILGLGLLIGLVAVLLTKNLNSDLVALIVFGYLATIFGICFLLARQVPKLVDAKLKAWSGAGDRETHAELKPVTTAQLEEFRQPAMSVTENTTKTLDKVPFAER